MAWPVFWLLLPVVLAADRPRGHGGGRYVAQGRRPLYFAITTFIFTLVLTVSSRSTRRLDRRPPGPARTPAFPGFPAGFGMRSGPRSSWCIDAGAPGVRRPRVEHPALAALPGAPVDPRRGTLRGSGRRPHGLDQGRHLRPVRRDGRRRRLAVLVPRRRSRPASSTGPGRRSISW